jgi:hypothetical protein
MCRPVLRTAFILLLLRAISSLVGQHGGKADNLIVSAMWFLYGPTYVKTRLPKLLLMLFTYAYIWGCWSKDYFSCLIWISHESHVQYICWLTWRYFQLPSFDSVERQCDYQTRSRDKDDIMFLSGLAKTGKVLIHYTPESPDYEERVPTSQFRRS